ncbi:MAG: histidine kinase [Chitinophagaceae bacterium]
MNLSGLPISILFFLFLFFKLPGAGAQNCHCDEYAGLQSQEASAAEGHIQKLLHSSVTICRARGFEWKASLLMDEKEFDSAADCLQQATALLKKLDCGDSIFMQTYKNYARLYYTTGDFPKAQEYSFQYLRAAEAAKDNYELANACTMIAQLFNQTGQAEQGIVYTRKAVQIVPGITDPVRQSDILFKVSKRYLWHYQDTKRTASLDSSELFSREEIRIAGKYGIRKDLSRAFNNLEGVAWEREDYDQALIFLDSSFKYIDPDQHDNLAVNYFDKADLMIELGKLDEADRMADSALYYYELSGSKPFLADGYELKSRIAAGRNDYKNAFLLKEKAHNITDSIRSDETAKKVAELEKKYNQEKNEKKIEKLAQQKRIYILLALTGLFALAGLVFFIRQQSLKNKQRILETEQRLNRARMNPHFFFNALSSLQSYALEGNDGKSIASNLSKFSHIMRETLESTYKEYVTIEQETDFLKEYLELQKIRFPQKFSYTITTSPTVEPDETVIPSMILQPFAENSIEHGFSGTGYPGQLNITFDQKDKNLLITISDNGKGLVGLPKENTQHISRASQIIRDRIYLLNIKLKTKASFSIDNNPDGKGVTVQIQLPLLYKEAMMA